MRVVRSGSLVLSAFLIVAYVELLRVFLILWREILECSPYLDDVSVEMIQLRYH